jgi:hypothetical protein
MKTIGNVVFLGTSTLIPPLNKRKNPLKKFMIINMNTEITHALLFDGGTSLRLPTLWRPQDFKGFQQKIKGHMKKYTGLDVHPIDDHTTLTDNRSDYLVYLTCSDMNPVKSHLWIPLEDIAAARTAYQFKHDIHYMSFEALKTFVHEPEAFMNITRIY